jgi:hypothetical protein
VSETLTPVLLPPQFNLDRFRGFVEDVFKDAGWIHPEGGIAAYQEEGCPNTTTLRYYAAAFPSGGGTAIRVALYQNFDREFLIGAIEAIFPDLEREAAKELLTKMEKAAANDADRLPVI